MNLMYLSTVSAIIICGWKDGTAQGPFVVPGRSYGSVLTQAQIPHFLWHPSIPAGSHLASQLLVTLPPPHVPPPDMSMMCCVVHVLPSQQRVCIGSRAHEPAKEPGLGLRRSVSGEHMCKWLVKRSHVREQMV